MVASKSLQAIREGTIRNYKIQKTDTWMTWADDKKFELILSSIISSTSLHNVNLLAGSRVPLLIWSNYWETKNKKYWAQLCSSSNLYFTWIPRRVRVQPGNPGLWINTYSLTRRCCASLLVLIIFFIYFCNSKTLISIFTLLSKL